MLLRKAYEAVPSGGVLVAYDSVIDDDRSENAFGLMMSLNMLIETPGGFDYTGADCMEWMRGRVPRGPSRAPGRPGLDGRRHQVGRGRVAYSRNAVRSRPYSSSQTGCGASSSRVNLTTGSASAASNCELSAKKKWHQKKTSHSCSASSMRQSTGRTSMPSMNLLPRLRRACAIPRPGAGASRLEACHRHLSLGIP